MGCWQGYTNFSEDEISGIEVRDPSIVIADTSHGKQGIGHDLYSGVGQT